MSRAVTSALHELNRKLVKAYPFRVHYMPAPISTRQLGNGPTDAELSLQDEYADALIGALVMSYQQPIENGIETVRGESRADIAEWVLDYFRRNTQTTTALTIIALSYNRRGFNLGGSMGLEWMGLNGNFTLTEENILAQIDTLVESLATPDGDISLLRTTARELARQVYRLNLEEAELGEMFSTLRQYAERRARVRSVNIAEYETVRMDRWDMTATFGLNGVTEVIFRTQGDAAVDGGDPDGPCAIREGLDFPVLSIPADSTIPIHNGCRCFYEPDLLEWVIPETVWTGGVL